MTITTIEHQYLKLIKSLTEEEQSLFCEGLQRLIEDDDRALTEEDTLAEEIADRSFSRKERIELERETLARHFQHRRELLEGAFTASEVAKNLLRTSRQTPHDRVRSQTLLAIRDNGKLYFPYWQFDPEGSDGVVEGFPEVIKALQLSDYAKMVWLTRPNPDLENLTPIEALKKGKKEQVLEQARSAEASQWS